MVCFPPGEVKNRKGTAANGEEFQCSKATGRVIELILQDCSLRGGHLLSQLGNLTSLQLLDLRHNYFDSIKNLEWLSHLSSLKYPDLSTIDLTLAVLDLNSNNLTAFTFQWLSNFNLSNSLVLLMLSRNVFQGPIPETFGHLTSLEYLYLKENQFEGGIPKSFEGPTRLDWRKVKFIKFLNLKSNNFYGEIPLQICQLTSILLQDLSNNSLSQHIPWCIGILTALARKDTFVEEYHYFVNSAMAGFYVDKALVMWKGIEYHYEYLKNLRIIDLSGNKLMGEILMQIWSLFELVSTEFVKKQFDRKDFTRYWADGTVGVA
ncbi:hypothetical protein SLEP1_g57888 [Rubroshorea leprosula]|uniref:Uncharacterized protein n=1 Tax=Rubroshorea leprosula TaxID=152421 RepID=A0AAV5MQE2_9ROSI|nr:hypothetical protein SLEP1_g57888 [Rubroshorea leprosula]